MPEILNSPRLFTYQDSNQPGDRLDRFLANHLEISRKLIQKLIKETKVLVNAKKSEADYILKEGDKVAVELPLPSVFDLKPLDLGLPIIFEDDSLAVLEKPAGLTVHPTLGEADSATVVSFLLHRFAELPLFKKVKPDPQNLDTLRPGIVHRLDKFTSGLMVVAKNEAAQENLKDQFRNRQVNKEYLALTDGLIEHKSGYIDQMIGRDENNFQKFKIDKHNGKDAYTDYAVLGRFRGYNRKFTFVKAHPKTGRTHQIRVHFAFIKHPLVGDRLYGGSPLLDRYFLHANHIEFEHPETQKGLSFDSPLPGELKQFLDNLEPLTP